MSSSGIQIISVEGFPLVHENDELSEMILSTLKKNNQVLHEGDILVISHKIVSKSEGKIYRLSDITPSLKATEIALKIGQSPQKIEIAIQESTNIVREEPILITTTKQGLITDFSGVDQSNAPEGTIIALPNEPDASAKGIHLRISKATGFNVPVIITDTQGRPWRKGAVNLAIGVAGMFPFQINEGKIDRHGRPLRSSLVCIVDEIAAAAELVMGQAAEKIPIVIVRGIQYDLSDGKAKSIMRDKSENLFL